MAEECFICRKHRGQVDVPGGIIYQDERVSSSHVVFGEGETRAYPVLFVEPRRHVPGLAELTDPEASRLGVLCARLARALRDCAGAERTYVSVLGHHVPHLHVWLVPRYPDTPAEYFGLAVRDWPGAPRLDARGIGALVQRIRDHLAAQG